MINLVFYYDLRIIDEFRFYFIRLAYYLDLA